METSKSNFPPNILYKNRYCNRDDFSILVSGGRDGNYEVVKSVYQLYGSELKCKEYTYLPKRLYNCKTAVVNSELFLAGGITQNGKYNDAVRKFCKNTNTWLDVSNSVRCELKTQLDLSNEKFCIFSFKQNLYVIYSYVYSSKCIVYNDKDDKWSQIADLNEERIAAAFTVFEGKIVVSGGFQSSVEAYDYYENKWTFLPDMIHSLRQHVSVSIGNKLFVIGGFEKSCEIFDSFSRKFCSIKTCLDFTNAMSCI